MNKKSILLSLLAFLAVSCRSYTDDIAVTVEQPVIPALTIKLTNPVLKMQLIRTVPEKYTVQSVTLSLEGTSDLNDIIAVSIHHTDDFRKMDGETLLDTNARIKSSKAKLNIPFEVDADTFPIWVSVWLEDDIDLSHRINVRVSSITTDKGKVNIPAQDFPGLRTGVALRQHTQDGVHTSRIPGLTTTKEGTLIAIYDARRDNSRDLQGDIDIALNRSFNGGRTWQPMQIALDQGEWGGMPQKYNGVSDACILADENSGDIYIAGLWMYGVLDGETGKWVEGLTQDSTRWIHQWIKKGSQPGFDVKQTSQFLITKSSDDGATWSAPVNITKIKKEEWWLYAPAPGHGITLRDGTLVFPSQGRDKTGLPFSNITYSKDGGKTWTTSEPAYNDVTECMAVELDNGSVMLNMRDNRNRGVAENNGRRICVTSDLGNTWTEHPTSRKALIEPTCMASIHKHRYNDNGTQKTMLLFSNPSSISTRDHITLKASFDNGMSWPEKHWILLDEYSGRGYSCITSIDENTIGILYESSQADMVFQQIRVDEILGND